MDTTLPIYFGIISPSTLGGPPHTFKIKIEPKTCGTKLDVDFSKGRSRRGS
jgi:hypothetical protein